jgi:flagellar FliL protein
MKRMNGWFPHLYASVLHATCTLVMMALCVNAHAAGSGGGSVSPYLNLKPAFVVNLAGKSSDVRYLQVEVTLKLADVNDTATVQKHMPMIRHRLVLLFSSLSFSEISSSQGKVKLTAEVLKEVKEGLKKMTGKEIIEAVYLPKIVGQ